MGVGCASASVVAVTHDLFSGPCPAVQVKHPFVLLQLLAEEVMPSGPLSQEVSDLVEVIWAEALGHLEHTLLVSVSSISLNDVSHVCARGGALRSGAAALCGAGARLGVGGGGVLDRPTSPQSPPCPAGHQC